MSDIKTMFITGKCKWAKIQEPQASKFSKGNRNYSIDVEVTKEDIAKLKKHGIAIGDGRFDKKVKKEDGVMYMEFKRPELSSKGKKLDLLVIDRAMKPIDALVGNGSTVKVKLSIIPYGEGEATVRLSAVQVIDLVEFGGAVTDGFEVIGDTEEDEDSSSSSGFDSLEDSEDYI